MDDTAFDFGIADAAMGRLHHEDALESYEAHDGFGVCSSMESSYRHDHFDEIAIVTTSSSLDGREASAVASFQHLGLTGACGWSSLQGSRPLLRGTVMSHGEVSGGICPLLFEDGLCHHLHAVMCVVICVWGLGVAFVQRNSRTIVNRARDEGGIQGQCSAKRVMGNPEERCKRKRLDPRTKAIIAFKQALCRASVEAARLNCVIRLFEGFDGSFLSVADFVQVHVACGVVFETVSGLCFAVEPCDASLSWKSVLSLRPEQDVVEHVDKVGRHNCLCSHLESVQCGAEAPLFGGGKRTRCDDGYHPSILPEGTKRVRMKVVRVYYGSEEEAVSVQPNFTEEQILRLCLARKGLHPAWVRARWRSNILYLCMFRPQMTKVQHDAVFSLVARICAEVTPASRLGSRTVCLGHRASGPSGISVATAHNRELVRALNVQLRECLPGVCWNAAALVSHGNIGWHSDCLDKSLACMLTRRAARGGERCCLLTHALDGGEAIQVCTSGLWQCFDPLVEHCVRASDESLSIVLYVTKRNPRVDLIPCLEGLQFPLVGYDRGYLAEADDSSGPPEQEETSARSGSSLLVFDDEDVALAQSFEAASPTPKPTISSRARLLADECMGNMRRGIAANATPSLSLSPTLPFEPLIAGQRGLDNFTMATHVAYDPCLEGECAFQCLLWLLGMPTCAVMCAWLRMQCAWVYTHLTAVGCIDVLGLVQECARVLGCAASEFCMVSNGRPGCVLDLVVVAALFRARVRVTCGLRSTDRIVIWHGEGDESPRFGLLHRDEHYCVVSLRSMADARGCEPSLELDTYVPDLTQEGVEPNPGPPADAELPKATHKRRAQMTTRLLKMGVDLTPHQVRTLVGINGACERLETARTDQQRKDILSSLLAKSGFKKEAEGAGESGSSTIINLKLEGEAELLEIGFQCKIDLMPVELRPEADCPADKLRTWALQTLKGHIHPVADAVAAPEASDTRVSDAIVVRAEKDYIAGRVWVKGDLALVLSLSGNSGLFYNPPLVMQLLYRVAWVEGELDAVLAKAKQETAFAGLDR
eukprot:6492426-Amphidinium_carterae.1